MSDNLPTNVQLNTNENGTVSFATDVVATIASLAATEVEGVTNMVGPGGSVLDLWNRRGQSSRNLTRGVKVEVVEDRVNIQVSIIIDYGVPIPDIARDIQENIKKAVETMSGLTVETVDVQVHGISFEREMKTTAEIEQHQRALLQKAEEEPAPETSSEET